MNFHYHLRNMLRCFPVMVAILGLYSGTMLYAQGNSIEGFSENKQNKIPIAIGSKNFNESYLLAEIISQLLEHNGYQVKRRFGMGGTLVAFGALTSGEIDIYIEYTGTIAQTILKTPLPPSLDNLNPLLKKKGVKALPALGFNNTYALVLKRDLAEKLDIATISDLVNKTELTLAFSLEFLNRQDGWPGLIASYGFTQQPRGMDHGLAYQAIDDGTIDVTDAYSTDGDLERYGLLSLIDNNEFFPRYYAVPLIREDTPLPAHTIVSQLANTIDDNKMRALNGEIMLYDKSFAEVAYQFLQDEIFLSGNGEPPADNTNQWITLKHNILVHLRLTAIALGLGCAIGLPLGILVYRSKSMSRTLLYVTGLLQTIPSIALLALMIPLFGIGEVPAIIALFLYSLLPILRSTITALLTIDPVIKRVAEAIGMTKIQQLIHVLIPLALPNILTGIKTAAIISIGTATLAAFIGAGGLGEPIVTGLALNDTNLILQGALPAAALAIVTEVAFEILERLLVKKHMLVGQLPQ